MKLPGAPHVAYRGDTLTLDACEAVLTVALASGITGIESVVYVGAESARIQVIKAFDSSALIFFISLDGQTRAL